jgi:hypothetical protein
MKNTMPSDEEADYLFGAPALAAARPSITEQNGGSSRLPVNR